MKKFLLLMTFFALTISQVYAVDCWRKPCHKKCITTHQTACRCSKLSPLASYDEICHGSYDNYVRNYCTTIQNQRNSSKRLEYLTGFPSNETYDPLCDGDQNQYLQRRQIDAMNNYSDALRNQNINVNHSGNVNVNHSGNFNVNGNYYIRHY